MSFQNTIQQAQATGDFQPLVDSIPYASYIGFEFQRFGDNVIFKLPRNIDNIGNPILPAIHGGVIGGFMELSAAINLLMFMDTPLMPKIVDFSLDYLRAGRDQDTFAECQVLRQGSRVANVSISAWQNDRATPIAIARAHFLLAKK